MKYFAKKSQNGCSFNKHLHGCQEHLEIMTYNDCVGRLLNLTFQNLDSSPQAEEDENLQTDRHLYSVQILHLPPGASATGHTQ